MISWKFKPYGEGDMKTDPTESEFFTTDEVESIANVIVREGIQNSLDEAKDKNGEPVHIRIFLSGNKYALSPERYFYYIDKLKEHLASSKSGIRDLPDFTKAPMHFLLFEDFNTNGLLGNPNEGKDEEVSDNTKRHNFYYFWRNVGITGKPEDKLGRWGVGKTVFPAASRINSFWGLTVQKDTSKCFLLGQSVLKSHNLESDKQDYGYRPYGYYADYVDDKPLAKAIDLESVQKKFIEDFRLARQNNEPGLSIIVPFHREEIAFETLISAVVLQYYLPIIKNKLVVDIVHEDNIVSINHDTLYDVVKRYCDENKEAIIALFEFTKWSIQLGAEDFFNLEEPPVRNQPTWNLKLWEKLNLDEVINHFEKEEKIAFKVPVKYHKNDGKSQPKICFFKVFIQKDERLKKAETHYVRENITIINIKSLRNPGVRAMVLVDDKDLSNLLGDSENPAHTQWQKDSRNFLNKYTDGDKCISFVINSLFQIYSKLQKPAEGVDREILKNLFYIPIQDPNTSLTLPDDDSLKDDDKGKPDIPDITPKERHMIRIKKIKGGITVYPVNLTKDNLPEIELRIAYDTTRGNPLKKYQPYDFRINKQPIKTVPQNCSIDIPEPNKVVLKPNNKDFELTITGFDENRDLFVDIRTQYPSNDTEI